MRVRNPTAMVVKIDLMCMVGKVLSEVVAVVASAAAVVDAVVVRFNWHRGEK